jgi:hypothetical protein
VAGKLHTLQKKNHPTRQANPTWQTSCARDNSNEEKKWHMKTKNRGNTFLVDCGSKASNSKHAEQSILLES